MSNYSNSILNEGNANTSWHKAISLVPSKSKVLDIGCSSGNFGKELIKRKKCIVDGIEIDEADYEAAKTKLRYVYHLNVERDSLEVINEKYDIVYFGDVIEHLVNPLAVLETVKKVLNPDGKVLFSIPNMAYIAIRLGLLKGDFEYTETGLLDKTHLHFYSLDEVYRVFQEAGYEINHLDFVKKDYPKDLVKTWLEGIGLEASDRFYKEVSKPEASAFQFVGTAVVASKKKIVKRKEFGPIDLYESFHNNAVADFKSEIKTLNKAIEHRNQLIAQKDQQIKWIKSSRIWKIRNFLVRLIGKEEI